MAGRDWVVWRQLEPAARLAFDVPHREAALEWAQYAWKVAGQRDNSWDTHVNAVERAEVCIKGMGLFSYYLDWCAVTWGHVVADDLLSWAAALDVSPICVGQILGPGRDVEGDHCRALQTLVGAARVEVATRLHRNHTSDFHFGMLALSRELGQRDANWMFPFERLPRLREECENGWRWLLDDCPVVKR